MADGSAKPIDEIKVGDHVLATNPETGEEGVREVTHVWVHDDQLVDLKVDGGDITTTEDPPFWNETDQQCQESQELDPGDLLHTAAGKTLAVVGLDWSTTQHDTAYNLTVADIHTYYVLAGDTPVLVHNEGGVPVPPFVDGQDFEWSIQTPKGNVGMLAETSVSGGRVTPPTWWFTVIARS